MAVKYVALDLHQASTSISIRDVRGRVIRREVVPTSAAGILEVIDSAGGTIHVTLTHGARGAKRCSLTGRLTRHCRRRSPLRGPAAEPPAPRTVRDGSAVAHGCGHSSPGIISELVSFYRAIGVAKEGPGNGVGGEEMTLHEMPLNEIGRGCIRAMPRCG